MSRRDRTRRGNHLVRVATPDDAAAIARVHVDSFLATYPDLPLTRRSAENGLAGREAFWDDRLRSSDSRRSTIVMAEGDLVTGFAHLGASPDPDADPEVMGHVYSIHVSPDRTRLGHGTLLMTQSVRTLTEDGFRSASLWVVSANVAARRFYERLGWRPDGTRRLETLAVGDERGDVAEIVRYRSDLRSEAKP